MPERVDFEPVELIVSVPGTEDYARIGEDARSTSRRRASIWIVATILLIAAAGVVGELLVGDLQDWFANHPFTTALLAEALVVGLLLLLVERVINRATARRWRSAGGPALIDLLNATDRLHRRLEAILHGKRDAHGFPDDLEECTVDLNDYEALIGRYSALLTATPELARIYRVAVRHLTECRFLVARAGPFFPPTVIDTVNASGRELSQEIMAFSRGVVVVPHEISGFTSYARPSLDGPRT